MLHVVIPLLVLTTLLYFFILRARIKKVGFQPKELLSSLCFYIISINCFLSMWLNYNGTISWIINMMLLLLAAYFTKYLKPNKKKNT
ncbi:hypothetical protein COL23_13275 [Priestia aryabhattai]|nr:hypothetical protein COL23_13275 [Priestia aryabhattai]